MKKYTEKERRQRLALVRDFQESRLSRAEFCRRRDLPVSTFDYWRRTARIEEAQSTVDGHFVEVHVEDAHQETGPRLEIEVELPYGVKLRFFGVCPAGRR